MDEKASIFFVGVPRGGSSICSQIISSMATSRGYEICDIEAENYNKGIRIDLIPNDVFQKLSKKSTYYGPFRSTPENIIKAPLRDIYKIVVVRDPRDCIVSHYFAMKNIHTQFRPNTDLADMKTGGGEYGEIDEHCLSVSTEYKSIFSGLVSFILRNADTIVYRYEDIIFNAATWIADVNIRLALNCSEEVLNQARLQAHFVPVREDEMAHNRQGLPLDHLKYLKPPTIEAISRILYAEMSFFGYIAKSIPLGSSSLFSQADSYGKEIEALKSAYYVLAAQNHMRIEEIRELRRKIEPPLSDSEVELSS